MKKASLLGILFGLCIVVIIFITISAGAFSPPGKELEPEKETNGWEEIYIPKDVEHYHIPEKVWAP